MSQGFVVLVHTDPNEYINSRRVRGYLRNCMMETVEKKKFALITGASSGIGKAFAELLAAEGYDLVLVARRADELNRIAGMEMTKNETKVVVVPLDLAKADSVKKLVDEMAARGISPDIIINNAGSGLVGDVVDLPIDGQLAMINLNVRALSEITMRFLPDMIARNEGGIINVSSVAAFMPGPYMSVYYASKAFVQSFSDGLAYELKGSKVKVMTLCPGPVDTAFQSIAGLDTKRWVNRMMAPKLPKEVARIGWAGFKADYSTVFPGSIDIMTAWAAKFMPKLAMMPIIKMFQKPKKG